VSDAPDVMDLLRKRLRRWAYAAGYIESELDGAVEAILAVHAHELAEKQRAKLIEDGYGPLDEDDDGICVCGGCSWCLAQDYIDLIDPEARGRV
jgi:hypothetical protein